MRRSLGGRGSALIVALLTIAILSMAAGYFIASVTARSRTAFRSASWNEAGLAAESAADLAVAQIRAILPKTAQDLTNGWTERIGTAAGVLGISSSGALTLTPPPLQHAGEGNTTLTATAAVETPAGLLFTQYGGRQWIRVRATGFASVPGRHLANASKLDRPLRKLRLILDNGKPVATPTISRTLELVVRPVLPFESAIVSEGAIDIPSPSAAVDSFNSLGLLKGYDSSRRTENGSVYTNAAEFTFGGKIYGNAGTNNGSLVAANDRITGSVTNQFYERLAAVREPSWSSIQSEPRTVTAPTTIQPRLFQSAKYNLAQISDTLTIKRGLPGSSTKVDLWVTGDITGGIKVEDGMTATVYVAGNVRVRASDLENDNDRAENLVLYGIQPPAGETREIEIQLGRDVYSSIYAPGHTLRLTGDGDLMGSFTAKSVSATGSARFHYDEALKLRIGNVLDYKVASWVEDLR